MNMVTSVKERTRDVPGIGRVKLVVGVQYVATRTVYDKENMPNPLVLIFDGDRVTKVFGPMKRNVSIRAVREFNLILDMCNGRW